MFNKKRRDVQIHAVATITNRYNNIEVVGEKETELPQFCIQWDARDMPIKKKDVQKAFGALYVKCLDEMRRAGLLRSGD